MEGEKERRQPKNEVAVSSRPPYKLDDEKVNTTSKRNQMPPGKLLRKQQTKLRQITNPNSLKRDQCFSRQYAAGHLEKTPYKKNKKNKWCIETIHLYNKF